MTKIMRTHLVTISPDMTLMHALEMLEIYQVSCIPVIDDERLIGIISSKSILMKLTHAGKLINLESSIGSDCVCTFSSEVCPVLDDDSYSRALEVILNQGLELCPVVNSEGRLVGMVSVVALLTAICENG